MRKICVLALGLLVFLCGCGKEEIYGTYYNNDFNDFTGEMTLYKNGSCEFSYKFILFGEEAVNSSTTEYCKYDYTDEKVTLKYNSSALPSTYLNITCSIDGKKLDCGSDGIFEKK